MEHFGKKHSLKLARHTVNRESIATRNSASSTPLPHRFLVVTVGVVHVSNESGVDCHFQRTARHGVGTKLVKIVGSSILISRYRMIKHSNWNQRLVVMRIGKRNNGSVGNSTENLDLHHTKLIVSKSLAVCATDGNFMLYFSKVNSRRLFRSTLVCNY